LYGYEGKKKTEERGDKGKDGKRKGRINRGDA